MKKLGLAVVLIGFIVLNGVLGIGFATGEDVLPSAGEIELQYAVTEKVTATLSISANGTASCSGTIKADAASSACSVTTKLMQKKNGVWKQIAKWEKSGSGASGVRASGSKTVSAGTYKVVVSGTVTASDGTRESVNKTSPIKTFG